MKRHTEADAGEGDARREGSAAILSAAWVPHPPRRDDLSYGPLISPPGWVADGARSAPDRSRLNSASIRTGGFGSSGAGMNA